MLFPHLTTLRLVFLASATVLPGVATAAIEPVFVSWAGEWAPIVAAAAGGIVALLALLGLDLIGKRNSERELTTGVPTVGANSPVTMAAMPQFQGKQFSPRTPSELIESVQGLTRVAAKSAAERHLGLLLVVDGTVNDVFETGGDTTTVYVEEEKDNIHVFLHFDTTIWGSKLKALNKRDRIVGVGKIDDISNHLRLVECTLIDSESQ